MESPPVPKKQLKKIYNEVSAYLRALLKKDMHDNKFIIFSQVRTGSHLLTDLLNCHPDIFCAGEIFHHDAVRAKLFFPMLYIKGRIVRFEKRFHGFQSKPYQIKRQHSDQKESLTIFHKNGWKIIHLQRRNILRQQVSGMLAQQRQQWNTTKENPFVKSKFIIDSKKLIKEIQQGENSTLQDKEMLATLPYYLEVIYEDDLLNSEQHQKTADRVFEYLGIDSVPVKAKLIKASTDRLSDSIENYDEIVSSISKTKYAKFLDEK